MQPKPDNKFNNQQSFLRRSLFIVITLFILNPASAQFEAIGGGLSFSTGVDFNTIETGNPGILIKGYFKFAKKLYFIPSVSAYNRYYRSTVTQSFTNYMFQGDLDFQYEFFKEGPLKLVGIAGANVTGIISDYEIFIGDGRYSDEKDLKPGLNLGAGVEMYIDKNFDSFLSGKYIVGPWNQFVIQLTVVYHFYERRRIGW
jgi:hypothetical protein